MDKEQEQQIAETQIDDTESGWDNEGQEADESTAQEGGEEEGAEQENAQELEQKDEPAEEEKPEQKPEGEDDRLKKLRDQRAVAIGEAETLRRLARKMEADGFLDRDEIAQELGKTRGEVDALIDRSTPPEPGEASFTEQQSQQFLEAFQDAKIQKFLKPIYGTPDEQTVLLSAFDWAYGADPEMQAKRMEMSGDDLLVMALQEGLKVKDDFKKAKELGGEKMLLARVRELEAQLAEKKVPASREASAPEAETDEQDEAYVEEKPKPRNAREAHLAMLLG